MSKFKVVQLNMGSMSKTATLEGKFNNKVVKLYLTNSNSSWYDYPVKNVGDEVDILDENIRTSDSTGNLYVARTTAAKAVQIAQMAKAMSIMKSTESNDL